MTKSKYMIVAGASVVVVRDGKRKTIQPGGGDDFTEDEITAVNRVQPGCLRAPINEGRRMQADDEGDGEPEKASKAKPTKAKPAKAKTSDTEDDEDI